MLENSLPSQFASATSPQTAQQPDQAANTQGATRHSKKVQVVDVADRFLIAIRNEFNISERANVSECIKSFYFKGAPEQPVDNALKPTDETVIAQGLCYGMSCDVPPIKEGANQTENLRSDPIDQFISRLVTTGLLERDYNGHNSGPRLFANKDVSPVAPTLYIALRHDLSTEIDSHQKEPARQPLKPINEDKWKNDPTYLSCLSGKLKMTTEEIHADGTSETHSCSALPISTVLSYRYDETESGQALTMFGEQLDGRVFWLETVNEEQGECDIKTGSSWSILLDSMEFCTLQDFILNISDNYDDYEWLSEPLKNSDEDELRKRLLHVCSHK